MSYSDYEGDSDVEVEVDGGEKGSKESKVITDLVAYCKYG